MPTAILSSKGQITIPLAVRTALNLQVGSKLDFVRVPDGFKVMPLRNASGTLKGRFANRVTQAVSLAAMDEAIAAEAVARNGKP